MPGQTLTAEDFMKGQDAPAPTSVAIQLPNGQVLTQPDLDKLHPVIRKKLLDKYGYEVDENGEPLSNASEGVGGFVNKLAHDLNPENVATKYGRDFGKAIQKQGGWGLSEKLRQQLGADNPDTPTMMQPIRNLPANALDLGYRGIQTLGAGLDALPRVILPDSVVDDPVLSALAIGEGGKGGDFLSPTHDAMAPEVRAQLNETASQMFHNGATREVMDAWAKDNHMSPFGKELDAAIADRDAQYAKLKGEADNFKPTPDPKPTDVFPTDASRASDAEEWGKGLSPEEFMSGRDPEAVASEPAAEQTPETVAPEEPTISKKEADGQFKDELLPPKPQTTKEWEQHLTKDAQEFLDKKTKTPESTTTETPKTVEADNTPSGPPVEGSLTHDVVTRLTDAITNASKIGRKVQARLYSQARRERLAKATALRKSIGGEEGLKASLSALKGELPKADFEGVRDQFTDDDIRAMFDHISNNDKLHGFEPIKAQVGLRKLLDGELPQAGEIKLLDKVFPPTFLKAALKQRSVMSKVVDAGANALNLPRSLMSTLDLSAPFTQGVFLVGRKEFWNNFSTLFKSFGSDRAYNGIMDGIRQHPNYPWMEEGKLALTDIHGALTDREEKFMSNWAEKLPGVGRVVKASDRAYTGFLNKLRADTFNNILEKSKAAGLKPEQDPKFISDLGKFINNATGRGDLGVHGNAAAPLLSGILFSPRLMASRVNMLRPDVYVRMHPKVRTEALKSLLAFGAITTTALTLAKSGGADVETNPKSSDFAKIKIDDTRYNVLGGFGQYLTLAARMATAEKKTIKGDIKPLDGKKFGSSTRLDVGAEFLRSKLSPVASFAADYLDDKNTVGEPFEVKKEIAERFTPMFVQDLHDLIKKEGVVKGGVMSIPGLFGVNSQTYEPRVSKKEFKDAPAPTPAPEPTPTSDTISAEEFMNGDDVK